jgi:F-type H+-transporting ATPase subunit gamma
MEDLERIKEHLENIRSVEPIISALRTIAAGGWRLALKRLRNTARYTESIGQVLALLLPRIPPGKLDPLLVTQHPPLPRRPLMLVIASERGLCGAFNSNVLAGAERLLAQQQLQAERVLLATLGSRAAHYFRAQGRELFWAEPLPVTRVASFEMVRDLGQTLVRAVQNGACDGVFVIYAPYEATSPASVVSRRWLPVDLGILPAPASDWPPPIIETDVETLFTRALHEWMVAQLFRLVMESAASEQAARFRAMDAASTNLARMIEELTLSYHAARQHAITMEMLDLVAGAGILRSAPGRPRRSASS